MRFLWNRRHTEFSRDLPFDVVAFGIVFGDVKTIIKGFFGFVKTVPAEDQNVPIVYDEKMAAEWQDLEAKKAQRKSVPFNQEEIDKLLGYGEEKGIVGHLRQTRCDLQRDAADLIERMVELLKAKLPADEKAKALVAAATRETFYD